MTKRVKPETLDPIPAVYRKGQWQITHYSNAEGGEWIELESGRDPPTSAVIYRHENGWVYDFILKSHGLNPWRHIDGDESPALE